MIRRFFGRFGIRKVNMPNISGLTRAQAKQTLEAVGLAWTEVAESTSDSSLDQKIKTQPINQNTALGISAPVGFTYYQYVAPPSFGPTFIPDPPQNSSVSSSSWNGSTVTINGNFQTLPTNIAVNGSNIGSWNAGSSQITFSLSGTGSRTIQIYNGRVPLIPEFGISYDPNPGFNPGFSNPGFTPDFNPGFTPAFDANPGFTPAFDANPGFVPVDSIFGPGWTPGFKSVGVSTLVRTTDGLVKADDLEVGDTLISANINGFPYDGGPSAIGAALEWSDSNPNLELATTTVVAIYRQQSNYGVVINGDIFSQYHFVLVKRDGEAKFVMSADVLSETDLVYSYETSTWETIDMYEVVPVIHETVSINCEPYDMFFTERMLTHDSVAI
jgi:hypothetical protein